MRVDAGNCSADVGTMRCVWCGKRYTDPTRNTDHDESTWELTREQWIQLLESEMCPSCSHERQQ